MKELLSLLRDLQKVDSAIEKIQGRKTQLPSLLEALDGIFTASQTEMVEQKERLQEATKKHREKEELLRRGQDSLKKAKARQFEVKTNKEYEAILKEVETLEMRNSQIEDEILEAMEEMDRVRGLVQNIERDFDQARLRYEGERKERTEELALADEDLRATREKSQALREKVPPDILKRYETIRNASAGVAVIGVWKEVCQGCRMNLPPQLYNEIQREEEIRFCPNCNRILYWDDQSNGNHDKNNRGS
ncbi:MAG TPA: C4-type zinc ribbon domain-containing protein [Syntrophales bacterium]|nr:C4-type zinc ribbon domain-containing protein [Syntrophales bacterium]